MKKLLMLLLGIFVLLPMNAQFNFGRNSSAMQSSYATMTFTNQSSYTMTLKILGIYGGLYSVVYLPAHSSRVETFAKSANYKLKIKAVNGRSVSYHNAGTFSVTCTSTRRSEGRMSFQMSSYGSGLGPSISAKEFESNK